MKKTPSLTLTLFMVLSVCAQTELSYYLPDKDYNPAIPTPGEVIGYDIGDWHLSHDKLTYYLMELAKVSDRVVYKEYSRSWENRPLFHLIITLPANHRKLEDIRLEHLLLADPDNSGGLDTKKMPVVIRLGYGVHGNESSASNASVLVAYYLAASNDREVMEYLNNMVILIDPCLNPDGFNRHASWINMHKSQHPMADDNSRGFNEVWPGGRTNHYWFDLNRDWILVQQPESRGRVDVFHDWLPNVQTDHHEMGASSSFFFQPGVPSRTNPLTPQRTSDLTHEIGTYHQKGLDAMGSLYYTEERYDDFYYGKGSSYPDILGSVGILFEQAGTRGFERDTPRGKLSFPFAIRNQVTVSLSSLKASYEMRTKLLDHMRDFYKESGAMYDEGTEKAYVFGEEKDASRLGHLIDILLKHRIEVYKLNSTHISGDTRYSPEDSYIVPLDQENYRLIQTLFKPALSFEDSIFYDISTWTLPFAFNISCTAVSDPKLITGLMGEAVDEVPLYFGSLRGPQQAVGYIFRWDDYYAAMSLYRVQSAGLITQVATQPFHYRNGELDEYFDYGSIFIPVSQQEMSSAEIRALMSEIASESGLEVYALGSSYTMEGMDLGSGMFSTLDEPDILLLTGEGVSSFEAGEIWHLLDARFDIPVVLISTEQLNSMDLSGYTHLIMPSGSYSGINQEGAGEIERWLKRGGTLIAVNSANRWLQGKKLADITFKKSPSDSIRILPYKDRALNSGAQQIPGSIFEAALDLSHPIGYGMHRSIMPVFRNSTLIANPPNNAYAQPLKYTGDPLLSGYVPGNIYEDLRNSPGIIISSRGSGHVISFVDNPNFRAFWYGTNRLFINAVFFGPVI